MGNQFFLCRQIIYEAVEILKLKMLMTNYGFGVVEQSQKQWQVICCIKEQQV